jgi:hypothetical protein
VAKQGIPVLMKGIDRRCGIASTGVGGQGSAEPVGVPISGIIFSDAGSIGLIPMRKYVTAVGMDR